MEFGTRKTRKGILGLTSRVRSFRSRTKRGESCRGARGGGECEVRVLDRFLRVSEQREIEVRQWSNRRAKSFSFEKGSKQSYLYMSYTLLQSVFTLMIERVMPTYR